MQNRINSTINRFRSGKSNLTSEDEIFLRSVILDFDNIKILSDVIYIYSYSFGFRNDVYHKINLILQKEKYPGLSAICLKAVLRFWFIKDRLYVDIISYFMDPSKWDDFYDEIIFLSSFLKSEDGVFYREFLSIELEKIASWVKEDQVEELFDYYDR